MKVNTAAQRGRDPVLLLVHGAWNGSWSWATLPQTLGMAGVKIHAVDLPGRGRGPAATPKTATAHDLTAHARYLRSVAEAIDAPLAVLAHSYGGAVATEALVGLPRLATVIYLAAFMLETGQSCRDANEATPHGGPGLSPELDGDYLVVPAAAARYMFYGGCTEEQAVAATARLTPEHLHTVSSPVTAAAWRDVPTTYLVTRNDKAISAQVQRAMAGQATWQAELDSGHSPMLSHPAQLAEQVLTALERVDLRVAR
ncbi:MAG TPA: alpha/beta hydrolase [Trebonia sp.]|jgi:pimeloyl-ACP methyl ester carboxylesterase|nr:alpha/beta hydrolase [Trebonia sp.]